MTNEVTYDRQYGFLSEVDRQTPIHIVGAGSIGSNLCFLLAKMGYSEITVYDFDKVEPHNVPNQLYRAMDVGEYKVDALQNIVLTMTGVHIYKHNTKVENGASFQDPRAIIVLALDSLQARKDVVTTIATCNGIVDLRMGGEGHSGHIMLGKTLPDTYMATFERPSAELPCGEQSILYTLYNCVSEGAYYIRKLSRNEISVPYEMYSRYIPAKRFIWTENRKQEGGNNG